MASKKKTYLDLYLDNAENNNKKNKKKSGNYFGDEAQEAILKFNDPNTSEKDRSEIYTNVIEEAFKEIVNGVMKMPMFRNLPKSMPKEQLIDDTFFRLVEKMSKFTPDMIGKDGKPVKAFSYFSTIAKNFILEKKVRHEKILKNRADVESSIDLSILSEDTLKMMSNYDKMDVHFDDYISTFNGTKGQIMAVIDELVRTESAKPDNKRDDDFIKIGYFLKYLLEKWDKIEFKKKNEFMRILTLYTGLKQQQVSFQFKKFKVAVFKKLRPNGISKVKRVYDDKEELEINDELIEDEVEDLVEEEDDKPKRFKYGINSMEEFETLLLLNENDQIKKDRKNGKTG